MKKDISSRLSLALLILFSRLFTIILSTAVHRHEFVVLQLNQAMGMTKNKIVEIMAKKNVELIILCAKIDDFNVVRDKNVLKL